VEELSLLRNGLVSVLCLALLAICTDALFAQRGAGPAPAPPVQTPAAAARPVLLHNGRRRPRRRSRFHAIRPRPGGRNSYRSVAFVTAAMPLAALAAPT